MTNSSNSGKTTLQSAINTFVEWTNGNNPAVTNIPSDLFSTVKTELTALMVTLDKMPELLALFNSNWLTFTVYLRQKNFTAANSSLKGLVSYSELLETKLIQLSKDISKISTDLVVLNGKLTRIQSRNDDDLRKAKSEKRTIDAQITQLSLDRKNPDKSHIWPRIASQITEKIMLSQKLALKISNAGDYDKGRYPVSQIVDVSKQFELVISNQRNDVAALTKPLTDLARDLSEMTQEDIPEIWEIYQAHSQKDYEQFQAWKASAALFN